MQPNACICTKPNHFKFYSSYILGKILLLGKIYLGKNNCNNVTSVEYGEHSVIKNAYLNQFKRSEQRFVDECVRGQTLIKTVLVQTAFVDHCVLDY